MTRPSTSPVDARPLLVGESNSYGPDPAFALYPHPRGAAGDRLHRVLGLTDGAYLRRFRRVNLPRPGAGWPAATAHEAALRLYETVPAHGPVVLLGRRVATAFGFSGPLLRRWGRFYLLPHPSGRSRTWNDPRTAARVRRLLRPLLELPDPSPLAARVEAAEARAADRLARAVFRTRRGPRGRSLAGLSSLLPR